MNILALDTATEMCGVALSQGRHLVAEYRLNRKNIHNETLVCSIKQLLIDTGLELANLDAIAVSNGPGSFTGLRIGLSAAKALVFSLNCKLVAVNTMDVLACNAKLHHGHITVLIKARESECYMAKYFAAPALERCSEHSIEITNELGAKIADDELVIASPPDFAATLSGFGWQMVSEAQMYSSAYHVALLAEGKLQKNQVENPEVVEPFYLKDFVPKIKKPSMVRS